MMAGRVPNRRGEGIKLRGEILDATRTLIEEHGEKAVTLRSVARTAGIGAPSIYAHFSDCDAIVSALVDDAFDELAALVTAANQRESDPVAKLRAACDAYVAFAMDRPKRF